MSGVIALIEKCAPVPGIPGTKKALQEEISSLASKLSVQNLLATYNATLNYTTKHVKEAKYFLLDLDPSTKKVSVTKYKARESELANRAYTRLESGVEEGSSRQVVLVSVESIAALKRAYPNYFLDTTRFAEIVGRALEGNFPDPSLETATIAA